MEENQENSDINLILTNSKQTIQTISSIIKDFSTIPKENTSNFSSYFRNNLEESMQLLSDVFEISYNELEKSKISTENCMNQLKELSNSIHNQMNSLNH